MVKKEFTNELLKRLNDLSDIELIEELDRPTQGGSGSYYNNLIKAILDKRLKTAVQDLTENVKKGNKVTKRAGAATSTFSKILILIGLVQFIVIVFQFIYSVNEGENKIIGYLSLGAVFALVVYAFYSFKSEIEPIRK
ncbi:MAG: hypothetical protein PHW73_09125 [Atribacterota bacterium]|nr:hypothetical protein [Atribacterota bacterium]